MERVDEVRHGPSGSAFPVPERGTWERSGGSGDLLIRMTNHTNTHKKEDDLTMETEMGRMQLQGQGTPKTAGSH